MVWEIAGKQGYHASTDTSQVWSLDMHRLMHWFGINGNIFAILITVGVALLLFCCLECSKCGCREKDDLFNRHEG
jgi:hypothetical protein